MYLVPVGNYEATTKRTNMHKIAAIAIELFGNNEPCKCGGAHEVCLKCQVCRAEEPDELYSPDQSLAPIIDATVLKATATDKDVISLCETANRHHTASVCINSHFLPLIKAHLNPNVKSCTVINFPLGSGSTSAIAAEAKAALEAGAAEVDMVQNLSALLSGNLNEAFASINEAAQLCIASQALLKVILETCYLDEELIIKSCLIAKKAGTKFVKTSTGFGTAGATEDAIALMRKVVGPKFGVKASGGIRSKEQAQKMVAAGANRIGASSVDSLI